MAATPDREHGILVRGTLTRVAAGSFKGSDGEDVSKATAVLNTGRDYPEKVYAYHPDQIERLVADLDPLKGQEVTLLVYPKREKGKAGFSFRYLRLAN